MLQFISKFLGLQRKPTPDLKKQMRDNQVSYMQTQRRTLYEQSGGLSDISNPLNPVSPFWIGNDSNQDEPIRHNDINFDSGSFGGGGASGSWDDTPSHSDNSSYNSGSSYDSGSSSDSSSYDSGSSCDSSSSSSDY